MNSIIEKILNVCLIIIVIVPSISTYAQSRKTILAIGNNVVDDTFTANYKLFNVTEQWNVGKFPSYFTLKREILNRTFAGISLTTNEYKKGKLVNGSYLDEDTDYLAIDLYVEYTLLDPDRSGSALSLLDPFVTLGIGRTSLGKTNFQTVNYGIGFYIWLPKSADCNCSFGKNDPSNFGILFSTQGKSTFNQKVYGNQIQHFFGFVYKL